jgi:hypothetical protein
MNVVSISLIVLLVVLLIAFITLLVMMLRKENPFKPAFASLIAAFVLWMSHLLTPELEGKVDINLDLGRFSMHGTGVRTASKVSFQTEFISLGSLLLLTSMCAKGLREKSG